MSLFRTEKKWSIINLRMPKVSKSSNLEDVLLSYLEYCEIDRNLSQNTVKMYDFYLRDFTEWAKSYLKTDRVLLKDIDSALVKKVQG